VQSALTALLQWWKSGSHAPAVAFHATRHSAVIDVIVTMGCGDECPYTPGKRYTDWDLPDLAGLPLDELKLIRDDIARRVNELVLELD